MDTENLLGLIGYFVLASLLRNIYVLFFVKGENVIELAMYLDLLNSHNFPNWPTVFGIAEKALTRIRQSDPELYEHLKMISKIHVRVNPKVCNIITLMKYNLFK